MFALEQRAEFSSKGYPLPRQSTEIIDLAENREVVLGAQYLTAKILKRVKLVAEGICGRFSSFRVKILNSRELGG